MGLPIFYHWQRQVYCYGLTPPCGGADDLFGSVADVGLASMIGVASWCYSETWASAPWAEPQPLEAVQHLRSLLNSATGTETDKHVPNKLRSVVGSIFDGIEEKIKSHCKIKHLVHVEYQKDMNTGRDLVRVWRWVAIDHYTDFSHEPHDCPDGLILRLEKDRGGQHLDQENMAYINMEYVWNILLNHQRSK